MPDKMMPESFVTATASIEVDGVTTIFSSSIGTKAGQESIMLDIAWRKTMIQFNEDLDGAKEEKK